MTSGVPYSETSAVATEKGRDRRTTTLLLAVLAAGSLQLFRFDAQFEPFGAWLVVVETLIVLGWVGAIYRQARRYAGDSEPMPSILQVQLVLLLLLPVVLQVISRATLGRGDPNEIVMLLCVQNTALGAAAVSHWRRTGGIAFLLSGFLVLFVTAITDNRVVYGITVLFGLIGMWWLMSAYWDRLEGRLAVETRRRVPAGASVMAVTVLMLLSGAILAGLTARSSTFVLPGFMPTSGGNRWTDPFSRAGVGDGDMLVAAKDHALSVGPVDSEIFIESQMPSLYDAMNEAKGEPRIKMKKNQRIAVDQSRVRETKHEAAESQQSGREFSTVRRMARRWREELQDRKATAMLYVVGETPLHLALARYDHFDGVLWSCNDEDPTVPAIRLETSGSRPWITASPRRAHPVVAGTQQHAVKIINLRTNRIPSPGLLAAWHIDLIDRPDFFGWTKDGTIEMPRRDLIPQLTLIQLMSYRMNLQTLREAPSPLHEMGRAARNRMAPFLAIPESIDLKRIQRSASSWTDGLPAGWRQVESIVSHLRTEFDHDPTAIAPHDSNDTVAHFLDARRGPDYLFASTAAVMIRSLGYPTRLVSGFYVDPRDFDARAGQTVVEDEDAHLWVEVCIDGRTWIPIEPTPGYEPPLTVRTWGQWLVQTWDDSLKWMQANVSWCAAFLFVGTGLFGYRRAVFDIVSYALWKVASSGPPRRRIASTVQLLEWRAWMGGHRRPANRTLRQWYETIAEHAEPRDADSLRSLVMLNAWARYQPGSPDQCRWPCSDREIRRRCMEVEKGWTSRRLRSHSRNTSSAIPSPMRHLTVHHQ